MRKDWSQAYVAQQTGIEQTYISRLERGSGARLPDAEGIRQLAALFDVTPDYLMGLAGYTWDVAQNEPAPALTMAEDDIPWEKVPPHVRRMVRGMVDAYFAEEEEPYQT